MLDVEEEYVGAPAQGGPTIERQDNVNYDPTTTIPSSNKDLGNSRRDGERVPNEGGRTTNEDLIRKLEEQGGTNDDGYYDYVQPDDDINSAWGREDREASRGGRNTETKQLEDRIRRRGEKASEAKWTRDNDEATPDLQMYYLLYFFYTFDFFLPKSYDFFRWPYTILELFLFFSEALYRFHVYE